MDNQGPNNYNNGNNNYNNNGGNGGGGNGNNGGNGGRDNHNGQLIMAFVLVSLIVLFIMSMVSNRFSQMSTQEISYSQFLEKVEAGEVKSVEIGSYEIDITPVTKDKSPYQPTYYCGRVADEDLIPLLKEKGVEIYGVIPDNTSTWIYSILSYLIPLVLIWVLLGFLMKRMGAHANHRPEPQPQRKGIAGKLPLGPDALRPYAWRPNQTAFLFHPAIGVGRGNHALRVPSL